MPASGPVTIHCPKKYTGFVHYSLKDSVQDYGYTINPGQEQKLPAGQPWTITF